MPGARRFDVRAVAMTHIELLNFVIPMRTLMGWVSFIQSLTDVHKLGKGVWDRFGNAIELMLRVSREVLLRLKVVDLVWTKKYMKLLISVTPMRTPMETERQSRTRQVADQPPKEPRSATAVWARD